MKGNVEKWYVRDFETSKVIEKIPVFSTKILLKTSIKYVAFDNITVIC